MGELATIVKARRVELGLSQIELGEKLGLSDGRSYLSRIEAGRLIPSRKRLDALERALDLSIGELQVAALSDERSREGSREGTV
ncbi:helix-turn-helix domain-containing protein [Deinococcus geothermalis]|uniref:helix-turn-helix domain-containing protein n=1 Tax=Deinococcus geothermalis TaxID=68909 RepID=UPI002354BC92|nr:helix-turn-helix transcriptional regulator [Deinococcus geothermalis]